MFAVAVLFTVILYSQFLFFTHVFGFLHKTFLLYVHGQCSSYQDSRMGIAFIRQVL